jgi:glycosyltransferase involved in cell wall biosynthesis
MLKIGLDLRATEPGFKSHFGRGTGRYATEVAKRISKINRPDVEVVGILGERIRGSKFERDFIAALPAGKETVESQICLPKRLKKLGVDLFHFFAHGDAPAWGGFPTVVTVLDLIPIKFRELYRGSNENWRYHLARYLELGAIKNSRGIISISEATKNDLVEILKVDPNKIAVTYLGVDPRFVPLSTDKNHVRNELGLPVDVPLLLYVGGIDPRKNVLFMLDAFKRVTEKVPECRLVLAGNHKTDKFYPEFAKKIVELKLESSLIQLGYFPDENLPKLYQAVDIFLFPSLYEGFGLPVLEAARSGIPVLAGRNSSIPELLGGDYPLLGDSNLEEWSAKIQELILRKASCIELSKLGIERGNIFSWEKTAESTLDAYQKFANI